MRFNQMSIIFSGDMIDIIIVEIKRRAPLYKNNGALRYNYALNKCYS